METVTITPNLKLVRVFNAIAGTAGLYVTGYILYQLIIGKTPDLWFLYLPVFAWLTFINLGRVFGYYDLSFSQISLENNRLSVSGHMGGEIDLDKLSWIRLKKSRIEFEIQWSGYKGFFKVPWNFRIKSRLGPLNKALQERCRQQKINFESEL